MTLLLSSAAVASLVTDELALDAMRAAFSAEAAGRTELPVRIDAPSPTGFLRVMPAVLDDVMGLKVMTLRRGLGTRYLVLLYDVETSDLLAAMDAAEVTRARTAATTALAALHTVPEAPKTLAVVGSGFEAKGHVALFAGLWPIEEVHVHSRSADNRRSFRAEMSERLGIVVHASGDLRATLRASDTVLLATKSPQPVIDGADLLPGTVVLSIGSTRPDLRELDRTALERAHTLVVDAAEQVLHESGDIIDAVSSGALPTERIVSLATLCAQQRVLPRPAGGPDGRDLTVFKSVGTALQDLAFARALYLRARHRGVGDEVGEVAALKPFTT